jgi:NAD(P)-dependent dehydrogenase (short-subunit alcohol dehydrogenase family)
VRFAGKNVLILGGSSGIGLAAAYGFKAEGARIAVTGRDEKKLAKVAAETGMVAIRSDLGSVADSRSAIARVAAELGGLDVLFVNAGIGGFAAVPSVTEGFWDSVHEVNLRGALIRGRAAAIVPRAPAAARRAEWSWFRDRQRILRRPPRAPRPIV